MSEKMGNIQASKITVVDSEVVDSIRAEGTTPCTVSSFQPEDVRETFERLTADVPVTDITKFVKLLLVSDDAKSVEPIVSKGAGFAEPVLTEIAEPVLTEIAEPVLTEIAEPVLTEIAEPVLTEIAEPVLTEIAEPVLTEIAEPVLTEIAEPVEAEVAEPVEAEVAEPVVNEIAEPVQDETSEPMDTDAAQPMAPETAIPKATESETPLAAEIAEPVASEIAESVASDIAEPEASEIAEPVASEIAELVASEIADTVEAEITDPVGAKIAEPVRVEIAEPVASEIGENVRAEISDPVEAKIAEPVRAEIPEPVGDKIAMPGRAEISKLEMTESVVGEDSKSGVEMELKTDDEKVKSREDLSENKGIASTKVSDSKLKMQSMEHVSELSLDRSLDSDITPPPTCFMWFKKYSSPQRFMSKIMHKRDSKNLKPQKSDLPCLESTVSDATDSTETSSEGIGKTYENVFIGNFMPPQNEIERIDYASLAEEKIIPAYLGAHPSYDVMPTSGKVIILSVELLVKNAFSALVSNDIKAAPLWDAGYFDFVGMLTISDFINVLRHYYYSSPEDIKDIENQSISTWRRITKVEKPFVKVNGSDSLVQATKLLIQEGVHRIPVFDEKRQSVLFVLTRKRLLQFLSNSLFENFEKTNIKTPSFFRKSIRELKVGTFEDIATVEVTTKVIDALDLFVKRKVSSLPVVEKDNILIDIFEKFDVFQLAKEQTYHNLDMPIKEAISKADVRETAWICTLDETFGTVINRFVNNKVHRIVVINEKRAVVGIISLSDVLKFLVLNPLENSSLPSTAETIEEGSEGAVAGPSTEDQRPSSLDSMQKANSLEEEEASTVSEAVENLKLEDPKVEE